MEKQWDSAFPSQLSKNPWALTKYWLLLGQIRVQNPFLRLKSDLWEERVSRISSAHIFSWSLPFTVTWTQQYYPFPSPPPFGHNIIFSLLCTRYPVIILLCFWLWNLCGRRVSSHKISWNCFLFLVFDPDDHLAYCLFVNFGCSKQHVGS